MDYVSDTPCPGCGERTLVLETRFTPTPIGDFSLAGVQMKVTVTRDVWLRCTGCGTEAKGHQ